MTVYENGIGLDDVLLLRFDETGDVPPTDLTGRYGDFETAGIPSVSIDDSERTFSGRGRAFGGGGTLTGKAIRGYAEPDVGITGTLWIDCAAQFATGAATIVHQGSGTARAGYFVVLQVFNAALRQALIKLRWRNSSSGEVGGPNMTFVVPEGPFVFAVSRERTAAGYVVRYFVNGKSSRSIVALSDIGYDATDDITVGSMPGGSGQVVGIIDRLHIVPRAIPLEETIIESESLTRIAPACYRAIRALQQPGLYPASPDSLVQRELKVEGDAWALPRLQTYRLLTKYLPTSSWGETLEMWERAAAQPPAAGDGIDDRRLKLAERFARGYNASPASIQERLSVPLECATTDLEIREGTTLIVDDFTAPTFSGGYRIAGHNKFNWLQVKSAALVTPPTGANNYVEIGTIGTTDHRYKGAAVDSGHAQYLRCIGGNGRRLMLQGQIEIFTAPANVMTGICFGSRFTDYWTWVGVGDFGSGNRIGTITYSPISGLSSFTSFGFAAGSAPWLRVNITDPDGSDFVVRQALLESALDSAPAIPIPHTFHENNQIDWAGFAIVGTAVVTSAVTMRASHFKANVPTSEATLAWQVLRTGGGSDPDFARAQSLVDRFQPSHADGHVIAQTKGLYTSDPTTLLDRDIVG